METRENIGEIITKAISSEEVRKRIEQFGDISEEDVQKIIEYCVITRSSEIPRELLDSFGTHIEGNIIIKSVSKLLGIDEAFLEERGNEIFEFIYNNLITNGVVYHMTNSVIAEGIKQNGLKPVGHTEMSADIKNVATRMETYAKKITNSLFPFVLGEIDDESGFFYSESPINVGAFFNSPEWLKVFCGGAADLSGRKETWHSFAKRDYDSMITNINILVEKYGIQEEDAGVLKDFFNKYWNMFEKATPTLVLIPQKCLGDELIFHQDSFIDKCKKIREGYVDTSYSKVEQQIMQRSQGDKERIERKKKEEIKKAKKEHSSIYYKVNEFLRIATFGVNRFLPITKYYRTR